MLEALGPALSAVSLPYMLPKFPSKAGRAPLVSQQLLKRRADHAAHGELAQPAACLGAEHARPGQLVRQHRLREPRGWEVRPRWSGRQLVRRRRVFGLARPSAHCLRHGLLQQTRHVRIAAQGPSHRRPAKRRVPRLVHLGCPCACVRAHAWT